MKIEKNSQEKNGGFLTPRVEAIKVNGKLFYSERHQSWNIIRLKKEILHEFPQLKEKNNTFSYTMILNRTQDDTKKILEEIKKGAMPILLFFNRDDK